MKEQRLYGIILVLCGLATAPLFSINGAGILLVLMGTARIACKDEEGKK